MLFYRGLINFYLQSKLLNTKNKRFFEESCQITNH